MKDLFAPIYEKMLGIFHQDYVLIFDQLYDKSGYIKLGLSFFLIPLICWFLFYYFWKYPYGKIWHWLVWLFITVVIVSSISYGIANTEIFASDNQALNSAIAASSTGYQKYAEMLPLKYALYNGLLTLIVGFLYCLVMKQKSRIQMHLPF